MPDLPEDNKQHKARHMQYEKAEFSLSYKPSSYSGREKVKSKIYQVLGSEAGLDDQVEAALGLFQVHFDRSLETAISGGYWKQHPSFNTFVSMVDYSSDVVPSKVMAVIRERFGRTTGVIKPGHTYWYPQ